MATRSIIGKLNPDNTVTYIYCQYDGYYKGGVGQKLDEHYQDENKINQLLELGDLSTLGEEIGYQQKFDDRKTHVKEFCLAYGRDRGEFNFVTVYFHFVHNLGFLFNWIYKLNFAYYMCDIALNINPINNIIIMLVLDHNVRK